MGVQLPSEPINRHEQYLAKIAGQAVEIPAEPLTREEAYLDYIAKHGGGGGGTGDYDELLNQPKINDVTLKGNKSASDLGLASASALANKVDKVAGKDLSSNDYSDSEKQKNADNATAISAIKDGATIDSFADVESALSNKQDTLTAGDYISLNNGNIAVNRNIVRDNYAYNIKFSGDNDLTVTKSQGGTVISTTQYTYEYGSGGGVTYTIDDAFTLETIYYGGQYFKYTALRDSTTHSAGYTWQVEAHDTSTDVTEYFPTEDLSGYKLVIKSELDAAISSAYHHAGTKTCAELVVGLLVAANEGNVYNMTDSGTTTSDFIEGAGQPIKAGDNVGVAKISDGVYKFDLLSGFVDTSNFVQKSVTAGLLKNDGTVNDEIEGDVSTLKSGLTNLTNDVKLNTQDLTTPSRTKNLLPLTLEKIKSSNTAGTWNNNEYTVSSCVFTVNTNAQGQVISIDVSNANTTPYVSALNIPLPKNNNKYKFCGGSDSYDVLLWDNTTNARAKKWDGSTNSESSTNVTVLQEVLNVASDNIELRCRVNANTPAGSATYYPLLVSENETDPTFAPYIPSVDARLDAVESGLTNKQDKTDNTLMTADKTVVGAINELDTDFSNLLANNLSGLKIKRGYKLNSSDVLTFDSGAYLFIVIKPQYSQSAIYALDDSENDPQLIAGTNLSITKTVSNGHITVSFNGSYLRFVLIRVDASVNFADEIHLSVATPTP